MFENLKALEDLVTARGTTVQQLSNDADLVGRFEEHLRAFQKDFSAAGLEVLLSRYKTYGTANIARYSINDLLNRLGDKLSRIRVMIANPDIKDDEPLADAFIDVANYACIIWMKISHLWPERPKQEIEEIGKVITKNGRNFLVHSNGYEQELHDLIQHEH
jgi:hypothetical protein